MKIEVGKTYVDVSRDKVFIHAKAKGHETWIGESFANGLIKQYDENGSGRTVGTCRLVKEYIEPITQSVVVYLYRHIEKPDILMIDTKPHSGASNYELIGSAQVDVKEGEFFKS